MTKWVTPDKRKWEANKIEIAFEHLLADNGFKVLGIKEYTAQTDYQIEKDGIIQEYVVYHTGKISAKELYEGFLRFYDIRKQYEELKAKM